MATPAPARSSQCSTPASVTAQPPEAHRDIPSSRIISITDYPGADLILCYDNIADGAQDVDTGHGTHVAGSVLSGGVPSGGDVGLGMGMAPDAKLVFQAVEDWVNFYGACNGTTDGYLLWGFVNHDIETDFLQDAYTAGARIHSNSWGTDVYGDYDADSQSVDSFMFDNKDFLVVVAAGNSGTDWDNDGEVNPDSMASPGTAKNVLTVGASEGVRTDSYPCDSGLVGCDGTNFIFSYGAAWPGDFPVAPIGTDPSAGNAQQDSSLLQPRAHRRRTDQARYRGARNLDSLHIRGSLSDRV